MSVNVEIAGFITVNWKPIAVYLLTFWYPVKIKTIISNNDNIKSIVKKNDPLAAKEVHKSKRTVDILISSGSVSGSITLLLNIIKSSSPWQTPVYEYTNNISTFFFKR